MLSMEKHPVSDKKHFFLISGLVMFTIGDDPETAQISSIPTNAIVRHDNQNFAAAKLAKGQQNLHKSMLMKMPTEAHAALTVRDIVVTNVSYLGHMTEEEFQAPPEGMALAEVPEVL